MWSGPAQVFVTFAAVGLTLLLAPALAWLDRDRFSFLIFLFVVGQAVRFPWGQLVALLIKLLVLRRWFAMTWRQAAGADLGITLASTLAGVALAGLLSLLAARFADHSMASAGGPLPGLAVPFGLWLIAGFYGTAIELAILQRAFQAVLTWRRALVLLAANLGSIIAIMTITPVEFI